MYLSKLHTNYSKIYFLGSKIGKNFTYDLFFEFFHVSVTSHSMQIGNKFNKSIDMLSIANQPFNSYSAIATCFWIRITNYGRGKTVILHSFELTVLIQGGDKGAVMIFIQIKEQNPLRIITLTNTTQQWTHVCFSVNRSLVVYINGHHFMTSHFHLQINLTTIKSILQFGELDDGQIVINNARGEIADFFLVHKELVREDIENIFPFNTGTSRKMEYIVTWYDLIVHANRHNVKLLRFPL